MGRLPATLNITTNPTGYMAAAGAVYAGAAMLFNVANHQGVFSAPIFIALAGAVISLLTRQIVTPLAAPRDGAGTPLVPAPPAPALIPVAPDTTVRVIPPHVTGAGIPPVAS